MPGVAEPDVAVVPPANDVVLIGRSIFMHAPVPVDVATIYMRGSVASTMVRSTVVSTTVMAAVTSAVMAAAMVTSSLAATVAFRVRRPHYSKSERRSDRKDETKLLQHFCFPPGCRTRRRTLAKGP